MAEAVINGLHSLGGNTLGEVFRSLNMFIKVNDQTIRNNVADILCNFRPTTDLEKLIRIRLIDHCQCNEEILKIFKSEDCFYIMHALHCSWFFKNSNFDSQVLVDSVFPSMSFTTRVKVLKRYSKFLKDKSVAEMFFNCLKQRYGLNTAFILLPACSESFVKQILETTSVQVPLNILSPLFHNYPSVVVSYLAYLLECSSKGKRVFRAFNLSIYESIFLLIASRDPKTFAVLMEKYSGSIPYLKLGRRATKRFIRAAYESFQKNIDIYRRIIDWKKVVSCLSLDQIGSLQLFMLPKTVSDFFQSYTSYSEYVEMTSSLKGPIKHDILVANFEKTYGKPVSDYLEAISGELVPILPADIRKKWCNWKLPQVENANKQAEYFSYLPSEEAIYKLDELLIKQSEMSSRAHIVKCLFRSVKLNNDFHLVGSLVQKYILGRLRNDRNIIREKVLSELSDWNNLINIPTDSWQLIEELINLMVLNDEASGCLHDIMKVLSVQIHSRLKQDLPVNTHIEKLLKISGLYYNYDLCVNTQYEKQCLIWFLNAFIEKNAEELNKEKDPIGCIRLLTRVCQWNACHRDKIEIPSWMMERIENLFDGEEYHYHKVVVLEALKKDQGRKHKLFNQIFPNYIDPVILSYKLRHDPEAVRVHSDLIMKAILNQCMVSYKAFFKQAKLYTALDIPQLFCSLCLKIVRNEIKEGYETYSARRNSVLVLSLMLPTNEFIEIISEFYPKGSKINDYSDESKHLLALQKEISASLKVVNNPSDILVSLSKFAVGDYLKLVVGSINSICLRTPEHQILPLLQQWLDSPISLRKHFIRAYFKIAPVMSTLEMLVNLFEIEKSSTLRLLMFEHGLRFFIAEPSSETFCVLTAIMEKLKSSDDAAINKLFDIENIPDEFISKYLQLLWNVISIKDEAFVNNNRNKIINLVEVDILRLLNEDFCDILICQVFDQNDIFPMDLKLFAVRYLLYSTCTEQFTRRLEKVMAGLVRLLAKWNDFDLKAVYVFPSRNTISFVIDSLVRECFNIDGNPLPPIDVIKMFQLSLLKNLKEEDILEESLVLDISTFFLSTPENSEIMFHFTNVIHPIVDRVVSMYGSAMIDLIWSSIMKIFKWKFSDQEKLKNYMLDFAEILLKTSSSNCHLLALKILPTVIVSDIQKYKEILTVVFQKDDPAVKVFANKLFKDLSSSVRVE